MSKIGLITYQANHLKTEQVFKKLLQRYPASDFVFYALPFVKRQKRQVLFAHRPEQSSGMNTETLAQMYGCPYVKCEKDTDIPEGNDIYLILGAGILSADCVRGKKILNAHPGAIPASRGLDAFKWAIYDGIPVGNTLHFIDESVDFGEIVAIKQTPVYETDDLSNFAQRHYSREIEMMVNFEHYLEKPINELPNLTVGEPHMRMPREKEEMLQKKFMQYKYKYIISLKH